MRPYDDRILRGVDEDGGEFAGLVHAEGGGEEVALFGSEWADGFAGFRLRIVGDGW